MSCQLGGLPSSLGSVSQLREIFSTIQSTFSYNLLPRTNQSGSTKGMSASPGSGDPRQAGHCHTPILPPSTHLAVNGEDMDIAPPGLGAMGPPIHSSPDMDYQPPLSNGSQAEAMYGHSAGGLSAAAAAATSSQQPKVVQTAFIHKLYRWEGLHDAKAGR